jgi:hypothetical protein
VKKTVFFCLLSFLLFITLPLSSAQELFEHYQTGDDFYFDIKGSQSGAQTFTIGSTGPNIEFTLTNVKIKIFRSQIPNLGVLSIRNVDSNGAPTGPNLITATFDGNLLAEDISGEWYNIPIGPLNLIPNTQYALVLTAPNTPTSGNVPFIGWREDRESIGPLSTYFGGKQWLSINDGISWLTIHPEIDRDFMFEIYGDRFGTTEIPECPFFPSYLETIPGTMREKIVCHYGKTNHLHHIEGLDYTCDITYKLDNSGEETDKADCTCFLTNGLENPLAAEFPEGFTNNQNQTNSST